MRHLLLQAEAIKENSQGIFNKEAVAGGSYETGRIMRGY